MILTSKTYHDKIEDAELVCGSKYSRIADILITGIPYVEPKPTPTQYLPVLGPDDFPLSDALERYQSRLDDAVKDNSKMYFYLSASVSGAESLILLRRHPDYLVECGQNRNMDALVAIAASTHHTR